MNERTDAECPHTERLDTVWYFKDIPADESCAFDQEDESILNTFRDVPVTLIFTGFRALASRLKAQHLVRVGKDRNLRFKIGEKTRKVFEATCMVPLKEICKNRAPGATALQKVSGDSLHRHRASRAAEYSFRLW
ncbi:hypothetical protein JAAARDRAFT_341190 [Jaapia argillacea MUCL 33604]|uniref:Uncharacterized protein n=1 Tax=Jaapia argillacea MUCL 33604 TaxID=933084 RepID=A0A067PJX8_9AGAM|nr:hypothetical protein JAAARDRAFT_341190 [Jaapia argillacea MUCL 33604]